MRKRIHSLIAVLVIASFAFSHAYAGNITYPTVAHSSKALKGVEKYETATVVRVVDGDTIVATVGGADKKIRMIGINTPESVGEYADHQQPGGAEASDFTKSELEKGETIYLTSDVSDTDKYGRLLRYIWIDIPDEKNIETKMFNAILLIEGYADPMTIKPDVKYAALFKRLDN